MKTHSQVLAISLTAAVAMAMALIVALFCISYIEEPAPQKSVGEESASSTDHATADETGQGTPDLPPLYSSGLRFSTNGDGTCVLSGVGDCGDVCVVIPEYAPSGERVTAVSAMAFYGCTTVTAVQIPASVQTIGNLAFAACTNLAYVSVSEKNPCFRDVDGVLYTADLGTLLLYPPMRAGGHMTITAATVEIRDMAFFGCTYLKKIAYTGTAEEWEQIRIGSKNYSLTAASVSFEGA